VLIVSHSTGVPHICRRKSRLPNMSSLVTPLAALRVTKHQIPAHNFLPNTSIQHRPLIHYHGALNPASTSPAAPSSRASFAQSSFAGAVEAHLRATGVVQPQWRYTMYPTTHFHSTTHEVLVVVRGGARLCLGGEGNPAAYRPDVGVGDVLVVPAGVGHRLLEDTSSDEAGFEMVGSYPPGCSWDMCYGKAGEEGKVGRIKEVVWFERDPVYGDTGPAVDA